MNYDPSFLRDAFVLLAVFLAGALLGWALARYRHQTRRQTVTGLQCALADSLAREHRHQVSRDIGLVAQRARRN